MLIGNTNTLSKSLLIIPHQLFFKGVEFVVDATHLQFKGSSAIDDPVLVALRDDWVKELVDRTKGSNPTVINNFLSGAQLLNYVAPFDTRPALTPDQERAITEFDKRDDLRFKAEFKREQKDKRGDRCVIF